MSVELYLAYVVACFVITIIPGAVVSDGKGYAYTYQRLTTKAIVISGIR